jgi:hypothetical protein
MTEQRQQLVGELEKARHAVSTLTSQSQAFKDNILQQFKKQAEEHGELTENLKIQLNSLINERDSWR